MSWRQLQLSGLLLGLFLPLGCSEEADRVTAEGDFFRSDVESVTIGGQLFYTNEAGIRISHLRFDTAYQWVGVTDRDLRGVDLLIFNEDGSERARLTSERGEASLAGRQMKAMGNVVLVVTGDGRRIESEELNFDPYGDRIWSDLPFSVSTPGQGTTRGCSFTSDMNFQNFSSRGMGC